MIRPIGNRVVVKRLDAKEKTSGGIIIPESAQEKSQEAEVLAVGPTWRHENGATYPAEVKVGDRIMFKKSAGVEVGEFFFVFAGDILGVTNA